MDKVLVVTLSSRDVLVILSLICLLHVNAKIACNISVNDIILQFYPLNKIKVRHLYSSLHRTCRKD